MNAKCEISCIPSYLRQVWRTAKKENGIAGRSGISLSMTLQRNFPQRLKILDLVLCFFFFFSFSFPLLPPTVRSLVCSPTTTPACPLAIPWINNWTNMRVRKHDENFNRWLSVRSLVQNYLLISLFHRLIPHTLFHTSPLPSPFLTVSVSIFFPPWEWSTRVLRQGILCSASILTYSEI